MDIFLTFDQQIYPLHEHELTIISSATNNVSRTSITNGITTSKAISNTIDIFFTTKIDIGP